MSAGRLVKVPAIGLVAVLLVMVKDCAALKFDAIAAGGEHAVIG